MTGLRHMAALAALAILAGCATGAPTTTAADLIPRLLRTDRADPAKEAAARARIESMTRQQLIGNARVPLILVDIEIENAYATLARVAVNGPYSTYQSADRRTLTFRRGLLVATRGLGDDLMSLDASETLQALAEGAGGPDSDGVVTRRIHRRLTALNGLEVIAYNCAVLDRGPETLVRLGERLILRRYEETCRQEGRGAPAYTNIYWVDPATGQIRVSRQWMGPVGGYLGITVLLPEEAR